VCMHACTCTCVHMCVEGFEVGKWHALHIGLKSNYASDRKKLTVETLQVLWMVIDKQTNKQTDRQTEKQYPK